MNYTAKKEKYFFGAKDGERIYLSSPSWDCGRYWGFGYLGNKNCHYHLSGFADGRNISMYDALKTDYKLSKNIDKNIWVFCELFKTAYTLKETAEVLGRGGSHYTENPCQELIKNVDEVKRINEIVLPALFVEIENLLSGGES